MGYLIKRGRRGRGVVSSTNTASLRLTCTQSSSPSHSLSHLRPRIPVVSRNYTSSPSPLLGRRANFYHPFPAPPLPLRGSAVSQIRLSRFGLAKPRNTLVSAVSSFTPARRCLLGVADGLAAPSQLKRLGNAVVDGFVYFAASDSGTSQLMLTTS